MNLVIASSKVNSSIMDPYDYDKEDCVESSRSNLSTSFLREMFGNSSEDEFDGFTWKKT